jgi:hypothetical protein
MNLVTVVCEKDYIFFKLQVESILKFFEPCTHWVIINEDTPTEETWEKRVRDLYSTTVHQVKVLFLYDFMHLTGSGWQKQQALKFLISKYINNDYLILDSKNFFIRNSNTDNWKDAIGSGFHETITGSIWEEASNYYALNYFKTVPLHRCLSVQTPFMFHKSYLDKLDDVESAMRFFNSKDLKTLHSEFLFYSYLLDKPLPSTGEQHKTFWKNITPNNDLFETLIEEYNKGFLVFGLHRDFIRSLDKTKIMKIDQFFEFLGLQFRFTNVKLYL